VCLDVLDTFSIGLASQSLRDVSLEEAGQELHPPLTALHLRIIRVPQGIFGDAVRQIPVRASSEGSSAEDELVSADTERPPIDCVRVAFLDENFGCHVSHRSRHAG